MKLSDRLTSFFCYVCVGVCVRVSLCVCIKVVTLLHFMLHSLSLQID